MSTNQLSLLPPTTRNRIRYTSSVNKEIGRETFLKLLKQGSSVLMTGVPRCATNETSAGFLMRVVKKAKQAVIAELDQKTIQEMQETLGNGKSCKIHNRNIFAHMEATSDRFDLVWIDLEGNLYTNDWKRLVQRRHKAKTILLTFSNSRRNDHQKDCAVPDDQDTIRWIQSQPYFRVHNAVCYRADKRVMTEAILEPIGREAEVKPLKFGPPKVITEKISIPLSLLQRADHDAREKLNQDHIDTMIAVIYTGGELPPLDVTNSNGKIRVTREGRHRHEAYVQALRGKDNPTVPCRVVEFENDLHMHWWAGPGSNPSTQLPMHRRDIKHQFQRLMEEDPYVEFERFSQWHPAYSRDMLYKIWQQAMVEARNSRGAQALEWLGKNTAEDRIFQAADRFHVSEKTVRTMLRTKTVKKDYGANGEYCMNQIVRMAENKIHQLYDSHLSLIKSGNLSREKAKKIWKKGLDEMFALLGIFESYAKRL